MTSRVGNHPSAPYPRDCHYDIWLHHRATDGSRGMHVPRWHNASDVEAALCQRWAGKTPADTRG